MQEKRQQRTGNAVCCMFVYMSISLAPNVQCLLQNVAAVWAPKGAKNKANKNNFYEVHFHLILFSMNLIFSQRQTMALLCSRCICIGIGIGRCCKCKWVK